MRTVFGSTAASSMRAFFTFLLSFVMIVAFQASLAGDADAKKRKRYKRAKISKKARPNPRYAAYVIDAKTGKVLHSRNANARRYPASLTKMMTLYLVFEDMKAGRINRNSRLVMTKAGWRRPPSKLGMRPGQSISMHQAILSLVTKSANDVSTAIGDKLAGSEAKFARRMTRKARQLGMASTTFKNANGLTARGQITTAADMAKLGLALREHFPRKYKYFQTRVFKLGKRRYGNHNKLLGRVRGVDGIKTGYTRASGFNLVSSVSSGGRRIVAVVMGGRSGRSRNAQMRKLIARYLPKASRGKGRRLITRARSTGSFKVAQVKNLKIAEKAGKSISNRVKSAHKSEKLKTKDVIDVRKQLVAMAATTTPKPQLRKSLSVKKYKAADKVTTASVKSKGWQIQIAASKNRSKLMDLLKSARSKNARLLGGKSPLTIRIKSGRKNLYRARFAGFTSKASAKRACKVLKRQRYSCLALHG